MSRTSKYALAFLLLALSTGQALAQKQKMPSLEKGEPPPGEAMKMTVGIANAVLRDLLARRYLVVTKPGFLVPGQTWGETKSITIKTDMLLFDYDIATKDKHYTQHAKLVFSDIGNYFSTNSKGEYYYADYPHLNKIYRDLSGSLDVLAWAKQKDAQRFADALNRLLYESHVNKNPPLDNSAFNALAATWRKDPSVRPKPPEEWERHRLMAEEHFKENDHIAALESYEAAIAAWPPWAEGWFNAALLYSELGEFTCAADRMKHYLELMPDAPDAKAARAKVLIWEEKAKE